MVIDHYEGLDSIVEAAIADPERRIVVDLAAQTSDSSPSGWKSPDSSTPTTTSGLSLTYWHVMDSGGDSTELLAKLLEQFGGKLGIVVVRNELRGGDFAILESSGTLARARTLNAKVMTLTRLHDASMQKFDGQNASFWAATQRDARTPVARYAGAATGQAVAATSLRRAGPTGALTGSRFTVEGRRMASWKVRHRWAS